MKFFKHSIQFRLLFLILISTALSACGVIIKPTNEVVDYYISPQESSYHMHTIALFPMAKDDTTDTGTFYSTNHFINRLEKIFPAIKFSIPSFDKLADKDSLLIPRLVEYIEQEKKLNLKEFNSSALGNTLTDDKPGAIIIGKINSFSYRKGLGLVRDEFLNFEFRSITTCDFTYYLVSLSDGNIIWKLRAIGEAANYDYHLSNVYPPLDSAISNGIDTILDVGLVGN